MQSFSLALATNSKRTCLKKSSKSQAFRQNLQNLLDGNSNETSCDDVVNGDEEYVQKSAPKRKTEKRGKKVCVHTVLLLVHYCITNCVQIICPNLGMTSN